ncbi:MAG: hypothetical protein FJY37_07475 [Betaproteobacteria bacterium]|nr:hypothetical protein [Betaproteobacteria bacterium]
MNTPLFKFLLSVTIALVCAPATAGDFNSMGFKNRSLSERGIIIVGGRTPGDTVSLNPQPLPPKVRARRFSLGDAVSLNPQPLPPRMLRRR